MYRERFLFRADEDLERLRSRNAGGNVRLVMRFSVNNVENIQAIRDRRHIVVEFVFLSVMRFWILHENSRFVELAKVGKLEYCIIDWGRLEH